MILFYGFLSTSVSSFCSPLTETASVLLSIQTPHLVPSFEFSSSCCISITASAGLSERLSFKLAGFTSSSHCNANKGSHRYTRTILSLLKSGTTVRVCSSICVNEFLCYCHFVCSSAEIPQTTTTLVFCYHFYNIVKYGVY